MTEPTKLDLFKDVVESILSSKKDCSWDPEFEKIYNSFVVNRALSNHNDCLFYANTLNALPNLTKDQQYTYLLNTIRARKRPFVPWAKAAPKNSDLAAVKAYYGYSDAKATEAMKVLTDEQVTYIVKRMKIE